MLHFCACNFADLMLILCGLPSVFELLVCLLVFDARPAAAKTCTHWDLLMGAAICVTVFGMLADLMLSFV